jgi:hypothetical protein
VYLRNLNIEESKVQIWAIVPRQKKTYLGNNTVAIPQGLKTTALLITGKSDEC